MLSILLFFVVLSALVLAHEFGHYAVARWCGIKAEEFGFGFPPRMFGFVRLKNRWKIVKGSDSTSYAKTIWSVNWLPLGGFVRLKGEQDSDMHEEDAFAAKPPWMRLAVLGAGVAMNWFMAAVILSIGLGWGVPMALDGVPAGAIVAGRAVEIEQVLAGSAAARVGIEPGDRLLSIDHAAVSGADDARTRIGLAGSGTLALGIERGQTEITLQAAPSVLAPQGRPILGIVMIDTGTVRFPWYEAALQGTEMAGRYTQLILMSFFDLVRNLVVHQQVSADLSGPVGIAVMTAHVARLGVWPFAEFVALLSLNLAVVNILPIPALDGGRIVFVAIEAIRRRKVGARLESGLHQIGFAILLLLIFLVTAKDLHTYGGAFLNHLIHR